MLDELEKLAREATAPPWKAGRPDMATIVDGYDSKWIYADDKYIAVASGKDVDTWEHVVANANYICALVNAAPLLLAAVRAAEAHIESEGDITFEALRDALAALKGST